MSFLVSFSLLLAIHFVSEFDVCSFYPYVTSLLSDDLPGNIINSSVPCVRGASYSHIFFVSLYATAWCISFCIFLLCACMISVICCFMLGIW